MSRPTPLSEAWTAALRTWLAERDERSLTAGYALGRRALAEGFGLVALSELHARALAACAQAGDPGTAAAAAGRFFTEALAPAELALRGYSDAVGALRTLATSLEARVEERSAALSEAERRYRSLIEQLPVVTYTAPLEVRGAMEFVSPQIEAVTGYSVTEWQQLPGRWGGRLHPEDRERVEAELARAERERTDVRIEYRLVRKDGRAAWVRDEARRTDDHHQGIWLDVTERRALEAQLRQAQKLDAVGRLAGGVAHDFNNLLTAILSFARFAHQDLGPGHPSRSDLEEVLNAAERAAALTRQLLAFSRSQSFSSRVLDVNVVLSGMERMLQRLVGERVELVLATGSGLHPIEADLSQLEQVILNLVVNAGDAMPNGGRVTIETANVSLDGSIRGHLGAPAGEYVMLAVSDTGVGMDDETQRQVFEPFFTTKELGKGTGLGLATVYGVVRQLRGELLLYSAPGRGTTFKVFLPASFEGGAAPQPPEAERETRGSETILLVEDERAVREGAARALRSAGFHVLEAEGVRSAEAIAAAHEGEVHLLVSDFVLGPDTGVEAAEAVLARRPRTRVLFISGYTEQALKKQGVALERAGFLDKPFTPSSLVAKVRQQLDEPEGQ